MPVDLGGLVVVARHRNVIGNPDRMGTWLAGQALGRRCAGGLTSPSLAISMPPYTRIWAAIAPSSWHRWTTARRASATEKVSILSQA